MQMCLHAPWRGKIAAMFSLPRDQAIDNDTAIQKEHIPQLEFLNADFTGLLLHVTEQLHIYAMLERRCK